MTQYIEVTGQTFGRLTAEERIIRKGKGVWKCICTCGNNAFVTVTDLRAGKTRSCGCLRKEKMTKHGMHKTRFYSVWSNMVGRCTNENTPNFQYYGGRGIRIRDGWNKFEKFKEDMHPSYLEHAKEYGEVDTSIERIDVDGDYEIINTTWATMREQSTNKRISKSNTSGFVGVGWIEKDKKWRARIHANQKETHLGVYETIEEAISAREKYKNEMGLN